MIGNHVHDVWLAVRQEAGLSDDSEPVAGEKAAKGSVLSQLIDIISGIFTPFIGVMAATGLLKGLAGAGGDLRLAYAGAGDL